MDVLGTKIVFLVIVVFWILPVFSASNVDACSWYSFHGNSSSREDGRQHCKDKGGDLVSMETNEEMNFIQKQLQNETTENGTNEWWIGLEFIDEKWKWLSNQTLTEISSHQKLQLLQKHEEGKAFATIAYNSSTASLIFNVITDNTTRKGWICEYKKKGCKNVQGGINATTTITTNVYTTPKTQATTAKTTTTTTTTTKPTTKTTATNTTTKTTATNTTITVLVPIITISTTKSETTTEPITPKTNSPKTAKLTSAAPSTATTTAATTRTPLFNGGFLTTTSPIRECLPAGFLIIAITVSVVGGVTVFFFTGLFLFVVCRKNCSKPRQSIEKIEMEEGEYENHL